MTQSTDQKKVTELDDKALEVRLKELQNKKVEERSTEEVSELEQAKEERQTRYEKRITHLSSETKAEKYKREQAEARAESAEKRIQELEDFRSNDRAVNPFIEEKTIVVYDPRQGRNRSFLSDETLQAKVDSNEITPAQAYLHQRERDKLEGAQLGYDRFKQEERAKTFSQKLTEDRDRAFAENPEFDKNHPNHNPDDPLYIKANELFNDFLDANGNPLRTDIYTKALKRAKEILRVGERRPDATNDMTVNSSVSNSRQTFKKDGEVSLSTKEQEWAINSYCSQINPATERMYTQAEAEAKALRAKKARAERGAR